MQEARKINTAYLNGVSLHFGNNLRMLLNILLKKNERTKTVKDEMKKKGTTEMEVSAAVKDVVEQCSRIKTAISSGRRFSS
ncbi:hypothetical protein BDF14DRAFT_1806893 [Spinellus fusiger]|nr:hypothetical protein BDF14DRAFT_1805583 [Spinellus fusiger]KAI7867110.1 hypothetical protein BDF14DRAFT_1805602 [Spinellus fusiger]KAI7867204.1 hypothetical protein BDF14DRAFT_1806893 [Spinellus fusiger]